MPVCRFVWAASEGNQTVIFGCHGDVRLPSIFATLSFFFASRRIESKTTRCRLLFLFSAFAPLVSIPKVECLFVLVVIWLGDWSGSCLEFVAANRW